MAAKRTPKKPAARKASITLKSMPVSKLKPHPKNPRKHPNDGTGQWGALEDSMKDDYFDPLVFNKRNGMLVSGHLRLKVLKKLGYTDVDVVIADYDEDTHVARMIAANRANGSDEKGQVLELLESLRGKSGPLAQTNIAANELTGLLEDAKRRAKGQASKDKSAAKSKDSSDNDPNVDVFPLSFPLTRERHHEMQDIIKGGKEHFGTKSMTDTMVEILRYFKDKELTDPAESAT